MIIDEDNYIKTHELVSIGDIANLEHRKNDILQKIEFMKEQSSKMREYDNANISLVNEDNFRVEIAAAYIRENNRRSRNICSNITPLVVEQVQDLHSSNSVVV